MGGSLAGLPIELAHVSWLLGDWEGDGFGEYPTVERFAFRQRVSFSCDGRPFLAYESRTWLLEPETGVGRPLATECGYWRPRPDNAVEVLLSHPMGYVEVWHGSVQVTGLESARITGAQLELRTDAVVRTESAKEYTAGHRLYGLVNGDLLWTFDMAAVGYPMSNHLWAKLGPVRGSVATG